jgi:hypothetical protein
LFVQKNSERIKNILEVSRDQASVNKIFDDCQSFSVLNLERIFLYSKILYKNSQKGLIYDITHDFHTSLIPIEDSTETDTNLPFLSFSFQNAYVLKISIELVLNCAKSILDHAVYVNL